MKEKMIDSLWIIQWEDTKPDIFAKEVSGPATQNVFVRILALQGKETSSLRDTDWEKLSAAGLYCRTELY